jgi:formylglycine-generating enzyme required for sulfatase activity
LLFATAVARIPDEMSSLSDSRPNRDSSPSGVRQRAALLLVPRAAAAVLAAACMQGAIAVDSDIGSPAQTAPAAAPATPSADSATSPGFKQEVDGCTFVIDLVPFKGPKGEALFVSTTEIPWELFDVFVYGSDKADGKSNEKADAVTKPTKPYIGMDREFGHVGFPVISPSFLSCKQFCEWLSAKTGRSYRLPTADEWKAMCEQSGIDPKNCGDYAWVRENAGEKTHKLASRKADRLGLFDLFGNACEWVEDGSKMGSVAGGCYLDSMADLGCGAFLPCKPVEWNEIDPQFPKSKWWYSSGGFVGFRVVCEKQ